MSKSNGPCHDFSCIHNKDEIDVNKCTCQHLDCSMHPDNPDPFPENTENPT